jgi:hypothetical protein
MVLPNKAVVEQMGEYFVFVARDSTINNPKAPADRKNQKEVYLRYRKRYRLAKPSAPTWL